MNRPAEHFEEMGAAAVEAPENRRGPGRPPKSAVRLAPQEDAAPARDSNPLATPGKGGLFPIKLLRNYRPLGKFTVVEREDPEDGESRMIERNPIGEPEIRDDRKRVKETAKEEIAKCRAKAG